MEMTASMMELDNLLQDKNMFFVGEYVPQATAYHSYVWQKDGIYLVREDNLARYSYRICKGDFELPDVVQEGIELKIPKIPYNKYEQLLEFFKHIHRKMQSEVYVRLYYRPGVGYFENFVVLEQELSTVSATWDFEPEKYDIQVTDILVLQIHSHHTMSGSFSSIDDKDHKTLEGVHMVIGSIYNSPTMALRFSLDNHKVEVDFEDVFEGVPPATSLNLNLFPNWESACKPAGTLTNSKVSTIPSYFDRENRYIRAYEDAENDTFFSKNSSRKFEEYLANQKTYQHSNRFLFNEGD